MDDQLGPGHAAQEVMADVTGGFVDTFSLLGLFPLRRHRGKGMEKGVPPKLDLTEVTGAGHHC